MQCIISIGERRVPPPAVTALALVSCVWLGACQGVVGGGSELRDGEGGQPSGSGGESTSPGSGGQAQTWTGGSAAPTPLACDRDVDHPTSPLLKLSTVQYRNTVVDLLERTGLGGLVSKVQAQVQTVPDDSLGAGFRGLDERIANEHVQAYFDLGVLVGNEVAADPDLLSSVVGSCAADLTMTQQCLDDFIDRFVALAYRSPVGPDDRALLSALNDGVRTPGQVIRAVIVVALSSPRFVYHLEIDGAQSSEDPSLLRLSAYELASRLSYMFWQTMPDDELLAVAADASLLDPQVYEVQLNRVFADPRSQAGLRQFWTEWLKLEKFTGFETTRPAFMALAEGHAIGEAGHDYYGDMVQEIIDLTELITFDRQGTLADLMTTTESVTPSSDLAALYGVAPWDGSADYPSFAPGQRAGLLQRAALLVSNLEQTNPFHRGALIRQRVLCEDLALPDPNVLPPGSLDPPPVDGSQTTRQRFAAKVEGNGLCAGCHDRFSNIGYVLESFDALGRHRTVESVFDERSGELLAELPIDTQAEARIRSFDEPAVRDAIELNQLLVDSGKVEPCLAQSYLEYAQRRSPDHSSLDRCVIDGVAEAMADPAAGLAAAFQLPAQLETFFVRKVGDL